MDTSGGWRIAYPIRIGYGYALDTPRIRFEPYPKKSDTYRLGYEYPTRLGRVFERETGGRREEVRGGGAAAGRPRRRRRRGTARARAEGGQLDGLDGSGARIESWRVEPPSAARRIWACPAWPRWRCSPRRRGREGGRAPSSSARRWPEAVAGGWAPLPPARRPPRPRGGRERERDREQRRA